VDTTPLSRHPSDPAIMYPPTTAPSGTPWAIEASRSPSAPATPRGGSEQGPAKIGALDPDRQDRCHQGKPRPRPRPGALGRSRWPGRGGADRAAQGWPAGRLL